MDNRELIIDNTWPTITAGFIGFGLAVVTAVLSAIFLSLNKRVENALMPIVVGANSVPRVTLAPLIIFYLGSGVAPNYMIAAWVAFFPTFINTVSSLSRIDPEYEQFRSIIGANRLQYLRYIKFWNALPDIVSGVKITFQLTIVGAIIAEFLGGGGGLGYLIIQSTQRAQLGLTFGIIILIALFASILYKLLSLFLEAITPQQT